MIGGMIEAWSAVLPLKATQTPARLDRLTPRERSVLQGIVNGYSSKGIAYHLGISPRTVEVHRRRVMEKLDTHCTARLVVLALRGGMEAPL